MPLDAPDRSLERKRPPQAQWSHPPALGSDPLDAPSQAGKPGKFGPSCLGEPSGPQAGAGPVGPGHHLLQAPLSGAGRQEGCCAAAHLREPPARSHPPRAPELGRARPVRRGAVPEAALGEAALLPDPVQTASPVPGPGTTPAGGGCAEPGERSGTHRRRVLQPGPRAAPAGATREMLAGSRGKPGGAVAEARAFAVAAAAAPARTAGSGYRRAAP